MTDAIPMVLRCPKCGLRTKYYVHPREYDILSKKLFAYEDCKECTKQSTLFDCIDLTLGGAYT